LVGGSSTSAEHCGHHCIGAEQSLDAREAATGPFVGLGDAAPESLLVTASRCDFLRCQTYECQSSCGTAGRAGTTGFVGAGIRAATSRVLCQPTFQLPSDALCDGGGSERPVVSPDPDEVLAVLGFGLDSDARAHQSRAREGVAEPVGDRLRGEGGSVDTVRGWIETDLGTEIRRRHTTVERSIVEAAGAAVSDDSDRTEATNDVVGRQ
jgi:hypothetical protein